GAPTTALTILPTLPSNVTLTSPSPRAASGTTAAHCAALLPPRRSASSICCLFSGVRSSLLTWFSLLLLDLGAGDAAPGVWSTLPPYSACFGWDPAHPAPESASSEGPHILRRNRWLTCPPPAP